MNKKYMIQVVLLLFGYVFQLGAATTEELVSEIKEIETWFEGYVSKTSPGINAFEKIVSDFKNESAELQKFEGLDRHIKTELKQKYPNFEFLNDALAAYGEFAKGAEKMITELDGLSKIVEEQKKQMLAYQKAINSTYLKFTANKYFQQFLNPFKKAGDFFSNGFKKLKEAVTGEKAALEERRTNERSALENPAFVVLLKTSVLNNKTLMLSDKLKLKAKLEDFKISESDFEEFKKEYSDDIQKNRKTKTLALKAILLRKFDEKMAREEQEIEEEEREAPSSSSAGSGFFSHLTGLLSMISLW
jgi:hypothetical protein